MPAADSAAKIFRALVEAAKEYAEKRNDRIVASTSE